MAKGRDRASSPSELKSCTFRLSRAADSASVIASLFFSADRAKLQNSNSIKVLK
jgi:hypothetical protein